MSSSLTTHLHPYLTTLLSHLPLPSQKAPISTPQKALLALLALLTLRTLSRLLSRAVVHNFQRPLRRWDNARELVLLSGGCSGIGKQVMYDFVNAGVKVVILDLTEPGFTLPANVTFYKADVTSPTSLQAVANQIRTAHGDPTVLINNAGVGYEGTILAQPATEIRRTFEVNTLSHFWMVREFLPAMVRANHGHVVTIASMASFVGLGQMADYCGSKASALAFHECLGQELRLYYKAGKVRASIVHPLWVRTPMIKQLTDAGGAFKMPVLTVEVVSRAIVGQVLAQRGGQVILPGYYSCARWLRAMPVWFQEGVRRVASLQLKSVVDMREAEEVGVKK
ncbi:hypothetical protein FQN53_002580 [Emmonsiellopsis sp. PD_33]|nr:hypothetical protein FQN53_002580 [Emmonsiellopsis sp. PD_33]